jgi:hypothetical protein
VSRGVALLNKRLAAGFHPCFQQVPVPLRAQHRLRHWSGPRRKEKPMHRLAALTLGWFLLVSAAIAADGEKKEADAPQPPKGFESMFNGRNLDGWKANPKYWKVEDGCLTGTADGKLRHNHFTVWKGGNVKNFEWRAKVKVTATGNSGLQYRSVERPDLGEDVVVGYQCDVVPYRADYDGMLYEERGRRILCHNSEKVIIDTEGQPWVVGEFPLRQFKPEEWHEYRVLVEGNHYRHWIDGQQTVDVVDLDEKVRKLEGILGMQVHVGPPMKIQFKDLFLKRLPDDLPLIKPEEAKIPKDAQKVIPQQKDKTPKPLNPK